MENLLSKEEMNAVINGDHGNVLLSWASTAIREARKYSSALISPIPSPSNS